MKNETKGKGDPPIVKKIVKKKGTKNVAKKRKADDLEKVPDLNELGMVMYNSMVGYVPKKQVLRMSDIVMPMAFLWVLNKFHALEQSLASSIRMHPAAPSEGDKIVESFFARKKGRPAANKKVSRPPKMVKFMSFERTDEEAVDEDEETMESTPTDQPAAPVDQPEKNDSAATPASAAPVDQPEEKDSTNGKPPSPTSVAGDDVHEDKKKAANAIAAAPAPTPAPALRHEDPAPVQAPVIPPEAVAAMSQLGGLLNSNPQLAGLTSNPHQFQHFLLSLLLGSANNNANHAKSDSPN